MQHEKGFTIIELMLVLAVVAVLSLLSFASYIGYSARAQASEAFTAMHPVMMRVIEGYHQGVALENMNSGNLSFPAPEAYATHLISKVEVINGVIWAQFSEQAAVVLTDNWLVMTPDTTGTNVNWVCAYSDSDGYNYVPAMCRHAP